MVTSVKNSNVETVFPSNGSVNKLNLTTLHLPRFFSWNRAVIFPQSECYFSGKRHGRNRAPEKGKKSCLQQLSWDLRATSVEHCINLTQGLKLSHEAESKQRQTTAVPEATKIQFFVKSPGDENDDEEKLTSLSLVIMLKNWYTKSKVETGQVQQLTLKKNFFVKSGNGAFSNAEYSFSVKSLSDENECPKCLKRIAAETDHLGGSGKFKR